MDRNRYTRISDLFGRVCDLPPEERRALLQEACADDLTLIAEVELLLEAEVKPVLLAPALGAGFSLTHGAGISSDVELAIPRSFGPYTVRRCISVGGMAVVYEAEQERPHRVVALKVLRGGLLSRSALKRFHLEAEVLGRLQHPGIARIYDAGMRRDDADPESDPGLPYFAMELIHGVPITEFADARGLDLRARMELLAKVCDAVQYAHQQGVIHRDLKPPNILVDGDGGPRVLDFGVARATDSDLQVTSLQTVAGQLVGTIPYMSPEQVLGDPKAVDTRTDVYSLGVILYELLSGRLPHSVRETPIPEAVRIIREEEPVPLASVDRSLRGDPATIAARALEKDKGRRYQSAAELGADIRHFLAHEPITARPASTLYQLGKLARRNRVAFVALAIVISTLAVAAFVSTWMAIVANRAEDRAVGALRESEGTSRYLLDLFMGSPDKPTIDRQQLLELAELRLTEKPVTDPRVEASVREYIGHGWHKLNYLEHAEPHLVRALELRRAIGVRDADMARCLMLIAEQRLTQGHVPEGQAALREALAIRRALFGPDHIAGANDADERELMYWTLTYTPDEPEAVREMERRRLLREEAPIASSITRNAAIVLEDEFDGDSLDPSWIVEARNAVGWTHVIANSRLTVTDIQADDATLASAQSVPSLTRLCRSLVDPLGDFRVEASIGWDSVQRPDALQYVSLCLYGPARTIISTVQYGDDWIQNGGGRKAAIGRGSSTQRFVNSGPDTLLDPGVARVAVERIGERVTVFWDGHELMRGASSDPLVEVAIDFLWTVHKGPDVMSTFGSEWIDSIRVAGTPNGAGK